MLDDIILSSVGYLDEISYLDIQNPAFPINPIHPNFPVPAEFNNNLELYMGIGSVDPNFDPNAIHYSLNSR